MSELSASRKVFPAVGSTLGEKKCIGFTYEMDSIS